MKMRYMYCLLAIVVSVASTAHGQEGLLKHALEYVRDYIRHDRETTASTIQQEKREAILQNMMGDWTSNQKLPAIPPIHIIQPSTEIESHQRGRKGKDISLTPAGVMGYYDDTSYTNEDENFEHPYTIMGYRVTDFNYENTLTKLIDSNIKPSIENKYQPKLENGMGLVVGNKIMGMPVDIFGKRDHERSTADVLTTDIGQKIPPIFIGMIRDSKTVKVNTLDKGFSHVLPDFKSGMKMGLTSKRSCEHGICKYITISSIPSGYKIAIVAENKNYHANPLQLNSNIIMIAINNQNMNMVDLLKLLSDDATPDLMYCDKNSYNRLDYCIVPGSYKGHINIKQLFKSVLTGLQEHTSNDQNDIQDDDNQAISVNVNRADLLTVPMYETAEDQINIKIVIKINSEITKDNHILGKLGKDYYGIDLTPTNDTILRTDPRDTYENPNQFGIKVSSDDKLQDKPVDAFQEMVDALRGNVDTNIDDAFLAENTDEFKYAFSKLENPDKYFKEVIDIKPTDNILGKRSDKLPSPNFIIDAILLQTANESIGQWLEGIRTSRKNISSDIIQFYQDWSTFLPLFQEDVFEVPSQHGHKLEQMNSLRMMGLSDVFLDVFWPFRYDINVQNQKLALMALNSNPTTGIPLKTSFYKELQRVQPIKLPVKENKIVLSFENEDLAEWLKITGVLVNSPRFMASRQHMFSAEEQKTISSIALDALTRINNTHPDLYRSMTQMVSCIAFYRTETRKHVNGNSRAALGVIWLDPTVIGEWSVPFMAEQIVHEFTHISLSYAEFVHGTYTNKFLLSEAKVQSAIRLVPRPFDMSLHAAYVSAGLITYHTRTGYFQRAAQLASTLPEAVHGLNEVSTEVDVLNTSGKAILKFLSDYMYITLL